MVATAAQVIGKVNPKLYAKNGDELLKKYKTWDKIPAEEVEPKIMLEHKITYDSSSETLEPLYFWILDFMSNDLGLSVEKLVDNFSSSPGSGHFGEMGQRMSVMQQQGTKILADVNTVLRSVLNIIYDLKDFKIRLAQYDDLKSKDPSKKGATILALKQIWMDKVDVNKGNSSIKALALTQAGFVTLIDAFLMAKDEKEASTMDLNERVKRIVEQRIHEFNIWLNQSEQELRKRYEIEKTYLKSQVSSMKIYSQWAKPYLIAAQQLQTSNELANKAGLVKAFNTILLQLTLLGKTKINIEDAAREGKFPIELQKMKIKRDYYACILVDFDFRGIPQKVSPQQPHYVFGGLANISFKAYSLNKDELDVFKQEFEKSNVEDVLKLIEGVTTESLESLKADLDYFLDEKTPEEKKKEETKGNLSFAEIFEPFAALFGKAEEGESPKKDKKKKEEKKIIPKEDYVEKELMRSYADFKAKDMTFTVFDIYKKAHGMAAFPFYT